jgi:DNA repair exonuclease SbcCD ATPase subunit
MIEFKTLRWMNLLSTGNAFTEVSLNAHKSTLIVGQNGAGKSTILDALSFVLYGKPFRKINKPQLINTINGKNCVVEVEFDVGKKKYKVIRGIKPNIFEIYHNGEMINQSADVKDYQEMLEKTILKLNHKSFNQIVILGSASFVPFMQLPAAHRREIIEDLLDIQIFSVMNSLLKDKIATNRSSITDNKYKLEMVIDKIDIHKKHLEAQKVDNTQLIADKQAKITKLTNDVSKIKKNLEAYNKEIEELRTKLINKDKLSAKQTKLQTLQRQIGERVKKTTKEIDFFTEHDTCPTCNQDISQEFKDNMIGDRTKQQTQLVDGLNKLQEELSIVVESMQEFAEINDSIVELNKNVAVSNNNAKFSNEAIQELQIEVTALQEKTMNIENNSAEIKTLLEDQNALGLAKIELEEEKSVYDVASVLLKDSGIKTKIIKQYIPVINKLINKYLASMDFFVNFELDENFEEKIKSRFRDEFSYASFSEGEKARLDLALLFTWRSIAKLRNSASTNLLILDEVFDGSLDNTGNDELLGILQALTQGNNVFVISHKTDAYLDKFDKVLKFEKHKNFSRIAEA